MMFKALKSLVCGIAFALAAAGVHAQGTGTAPGLLSPEAGPSSPAKPGRGVIRSQRVAPDKNLITQLRAQLQGNPNQPQTLTLRFFDNATFVARIERIESPGLGAISYHGRVVGRNDGHVVIVEKNGNLGINVEAGGRTYQLRYYGDEGYFAREVDLSRIPIEPPGPLPEANFKAGAKVSKSVSGAPIAVDTLVDDGSLIDVMVVYTQAARIAAGGPAAMDTLIATGISQVNQIYANSQVVQRLRLVHSREVAHTETNMDFDLDSLASDGDGVLDDVHILRDAYGADIVSLWGDYAATDYCGLAYIMGTESSLFEGMAFNLVSTDCVSGGTTFAHELGHNMGLRHDVYQQTETSEGSSPGTHVTPVGSTTSTEIFYSNGYVDTVNRFRTVMSYNSQCIALGYNIGIGECYLVPYFSNPAVNVTSPYPSAISAPTGNVSDCDPAGGLTCAHEQKVLNETRETTANFRTAVNTAGAGTIAFVPKAYTVAEGGGSVTLTAVRLAGSTGAVSVNYTTVNGTATAGSDYVAKTGTLSWPAGNTSPQTITITILSDLIAESNETFTVALNTPTGGVLIAPNGGTATVTIIDDEADGFPASCSGSTLPAGFTTTLAPDNWTPATDHYYGTPCSLGSAKLIASQLGTFKNSDLVYTGVFLAGNVTFNYRVSAYGNVAGQPSRGFFKFFVDGEERRSETGESGWVSHTEPITAGSHTLTWRFTNSLNYECRFDFVNPPPGGDNCADRAWIDNLILPVGAAVSLSSVSSRKTHPGSGLWDRPIDHTQPITGNVSTESRPPIGGNHSIVFTFNAGIATPGTVTCVDANNAPIGSSCTVVAQGTAAIVTVGGIVDNSRVKVSLANVNQNAANNFSASVGFLLGDGNNNRGVTASDILAAKGRLGQVIGPGNYAYDTNVSGTLTSGDVDLVKGNAGVTLN